MKFFWKYVFPPVYGLFFYTIIRLVSDLTNRNEFWQRPLRQNAAEILGVILLSYPLTGVPVYYVRRFSKKAGQSPGSIFSEFARILVVAMLLATAGSAAMPISKYQKDEFMEKIVNSKLLKR